jgi:hypothetical protein
MVSMLFCQLGQAKSLREIVGGLQASEEKLRHLGLPDSPRPVHIGIGQQSWTVAIIRNRISSTVGRLPEAVGGAKAASELGLPGKLLSLDATVIDLCAEVFDWAQNSGPAKGP